MHIPLTAFALSTLLALTAFAAQPASNEAATTAITQQLNRYEHALNTSDIEAVMRLYAEDGMFMPQHSPPAVGHEAVRMAYRRVFDTIKVDIRFQIDVIRPLSPDWAFARTRSTGTMKLLASDQPPGPEANQELFLLRREANGQ